MINLNELVLGSIVYLVKNGEKEVHSMNWFHDHDEAQSNGCADIEPIFLSAEVFEALHWKEKAPYKFHAPNLTIRCGCIDINSNSKLLFLLGWDAISEITYLHELQLLMRGLKINLQIDINRLKEAIKRVMTIKVSYEIYVDDAEAQQATDSQIIQWIEWKLAIGCELYYSPISDYEAEIEYLEIKIDRSCQNQE